MRRSQALLGLLAGLLALYLIAPFLAGLAQLKTANWSGADVSSLMQATETSVASASLATLLIAFGGIPLGYLLARKPGRGMAMLGFVVQLPLALPPLTSGVLLLFLLGYASPIGRLTNAALTDSFAGIVLAEAFVAAPFLIIAARSAFAGIDPQLEDVAATLGHRPGAIFRRVSLPLAWRGIAAGLLLAWLRAFGEFGATVMVAYHPYSLPVYTYVAFGSEGLPAMLPVLLPTLVAALLVMALSEAARPRVPRVTFRREELPSEAPAFASADAAKGVLLSLALHRRMEGFELRLEWATSARRLAILGTSGSGKSLTLRLIAGLDAAAETRVAFGDVDLGSLPPEKRGIAYVPQNYALLPHLTVAQQIRFALDSDCARALYWTARLGLAGLEHRRPRELSLGQQQRVALARALARKSAGLLLLDEPFSALDAPLRSRLAQDMAALQQEMELTTILVTHDPKEAMQLADELLLLDAGRVLQAGPVAALFARPASETVARLLGAEAIGHGWVTPAGAIDVGNGVHLTVAGPALPIATYVGWSVRPYQVRLAADGAYPATILRREAARDGQRRLAVQIGETLLHLLADPGCPSEGSCRASIDPEAFQVWPAENGQRAVHDPETSAARRLAIV